MKTKSKVPPDDRLRIARDDAVLANAEKEREIKACKKCGQSPAIIREDRIFPWRLACPCYKSKMLWSSTKEIAIKSWNQLQQGK
jgi:hypothetical protein